MKRDKTKFNYLLTINELDTNTKQKVWYSQKGAELWDWLATRGFVALIPYDGFGYFYRFSELKAGLEKAGKEGLLKKGGYFHDDKYYA